MSCTNSPLPFADVCHQRVPSLVNRPRDTSPQCGPEMFNRRQVD
jgi:hypothetical protein